MRANLADRLANELTTIPGARESLDALSCYPSAVVSNGPETKIRTALNATGLSQYFGHRLFSGYTAMGFAAKDCIAIDDALVGVQAALQAGMTVIHLNRFPDAEATPEGAIMISNMYQLPAVVEQLTHERWQAAMLHHSTEK